MIAALHVALEAAESRGLETGHAQTYLEAGEWLLALIELEGVADDAYQEEFSSRFRDIRAAMGDPRDPYD